MYPMKEVLKLRERLVHIRDQLYFGPGALLHELLAETPEAFKVEQVDVLLRAEPVFLHHERSGDHECVYRVSLRFAYVVPAHGRSLDRVYHTDVVMPGNEELDKVVAIVGC